MLPNPIPAHDIFTLVVHSFLDGIGIFANVALVYCVAFKTPKSLRSFSIVILAQALADLAGCTASLFICVRLIPIYLTLGMIYIGPCALVSSNACHFTFALMLSFFTYSLYLIVFAFAYRLYVIFRNPPSLVPLTTCISLVYFPSFIMLMVYMDSTNDDGEVRNAIRRWRPHYELDDYTVNGHLSVLSPRVAITLAMCTVPWVPLLLIIIIIRRKCLTVQATLPITFLAGSLFFYLSLFDIVHSPMQEHLTMMTVAIMPTVSPMISIRFIKPYRDALTTTRISQRVCASKTVASGKY